MRRTWAVALVLAAVVGGCGKASTSGTAPRALRPCGPQSTACRRIVTTQGGTTKAVFVEVGEPLEAEAPQSVKRAGGSRLAEFELGRSVLAQSGCLACHKIGDLGNAGPGQDLTRVGVRLSAARLERAIVDPTEPMPSFRNLPRVKLQALVVFLSLLGR
jgi:cbb3-type cytochrome oxidase cytochrome c subunit